MELSGSIKLIQEEERISDRFKKRGLVLTTQEQYPQDIMIEFVQEKTELLNSFQHGQQVTISINIRGREWKSPSGEVKYFTTSKVGAFKNQRQKHPACSSPWVIRTILLSQQLRQLRISLTTRATTFLSRSILILQRIGSDLNPTHPRSRRQIRISWPLVVMCVRLL